MTAADQETECGANAARVWLRTDAFDRLCEQRGATTVVAQAALLSVDRGTIHRLRNGAIVNPSGSLVLRAAARLGVAVEDLWTAGAEPPRPSGPPRTDKPPAAPHTPKPPAGPKTHGMGAAA